MVGFELSKGHYVESLYIQVEQGKAEQRRFDGLQRSLSQVKQGHTLDTMDYVRQSRSIDVSSTYLKEARRGDKHPLLNPSERIEAMRWCTRSLSKAR